MALSKPIKTIIIADQGNALKVAESLSTKFGNKYQVIASYTDMSNQQTYDDVIGMGATLIIVFQTSNHFTTDVLHEYVHMRGTSARVVACFAMKSGDVFDAVMNSGAIPYHLPFKEESLDSLDSEIEERYLEAVNRMSDSMIMPDPPPSPKLSSLIGMPGGIIRQMLQVITVWSSKGGDGKSMIAMEIGYILATVSGRKVLIIDADMSRGYMAPALGTEMLKIAADKNITVVANLFSTRKQIPQLNKFVVNYPSPFGGTSNLDILFGIKSPDEAGFACYTDNNGAQGVNFVKALIETARNDYEFIIFDIGTLIGTPLHQGAIAYSSSLFVVSSPIIPSTHPTQIGLEHMRSAHMLGDNKAVLIINKWNEDCGLNKNEFPEYLGIPLYATIPAIDMPLMQRIINSGMFYTETFFKENNRDIRTALTPLAMELLRLAEKFSPGTIASAEKNLGNYFPFEESRRGLFGKKSDGEATTKTKKKKKFGFF